MVIIMVKYTIARQLASKRIVTSRGDEIGRLSDMVVNENTGDIESMLIEPNSDSKIARKAGHENGLVKVPYSAVIAVSDVVIVDEREITE